MFEKSTTYFGSRPKRAIALIIVLAVTLILVIAAWAVDSANLGRAPHPSDDIPIELADGMIIYTMDASFSLENKTPGESYPYSEMEMVFQIAIRGGSMRYPMSTFGDQDILSSGPNATCHQDVITSSWTNVSMDITDSTGDGGFDEGDTIAFNIDHLDDMFVFTLGLLWVQSDHAGGVAREISFATDNGKLYAWYSHYLNDTPWYEPYL